MSDTTDQSQNEFFSIEILNLDELGYGPSGLITRRSWRAECLEYFLAGADAFKVWQKNMSINLNEGLLEADFGYKMIYEGGTNVRPFSMAARRWTIDLVGQEFRNYLDVSKFEFFQDVDFSGSTFYGHVTFENAKFHGSAHFNSATFCGHATFTSATFSERLSFTSALFRRYVSFVNAKFEDDALFNNAFFNSVCMFRSLLDFNTISAKGLTLGTKFSGRTVFESAVFKKVGHFEQVRFANRVPNFLGVDNATTRLEFSDDSYFPKQDRTEDAVTRLGHLKRLADEHGQTDQALNFNALELNAKAGLAKTGSFTKLVTWVYGAVSDYGRSFTRPIATYTALLLTTLLLAAGHAAFSLPSKDCEDARWRVLSDLQRTTAPCMPATNDKLHLSGYRAAAEYTLYRAAGVLDFSDNDKSTDAVARRLFGQPIEPWWMRVWGVFKAIASTALLFLTALGLRNKYRIK